MKENVTLLEEINNLRKEAHTLKVKLRQIGQGSDALGSTSRSKMENSMRSMDKDPVDGMQKELKLQDIQINELKNQIQELEEQNEMIKGQRPRVGKLPPLEASQQLQ